MRPFNGVGNIWVIKSALLIVSVSLSAFTACSRIVHCPTDDSEDCMTVRQEILNTHIDVVGQESLHESNAIWLFANEQLFVEWDSFEIFYTFGGATCDFTNLTHQTDDCSICNFCDTSSSFENLCHLDEGRVVDTNGEKLRLVSYEGFSPDAEPTTIFLPITGGCSARGFGPFSFTPGSNATYKVLPPQYFSVQGSLTEKKVFVIHPEMPQRSSYELTRYTMDPSTGKVWYEWTVRGSPIWEDNFSENLSIGQVRVLTGRPSSDPNSSRFRLEDEKVVRPSRIFFLRNFVPSDPRTPSDILNHEDEITQRCYVDPSREDGDIVLTRCRQAFGNNTETLFDLTPTYLKPQLADQLTWIVEFNATEGADFVPTTSIFDPVPANAVLAIEFTIKEVP